MAEEKTESDKATSVWDFLTRAQLWMSVNLFEPAQYVREVVHISDVNFVPKYMQRHIQNDMYFNMFAQVYPDPEPIPRAKKSKEKDPLGSLVEGFSNAAGSAVERVGNAVADQISATASYARNLVDTLTFGLTARSARSNKPSNNINMLKLHVPRVKVTEIRLNDKLTQMGIMFECIKKMFNAGANLVGNNSGFKDVIDRMRQAFDKGLDVVLNATIGMNVEEWLSAMSSGKLSDAMQTRLGGLAYAFIRNAASGKYMTTYELPHVGESAYMKSIGGGQWGTEGGDFGDAMTFINRMTGGNLIVQDNVRWQVSRGMNMGPIKGKFHLFNDDLEMFCDNLGLILRLVTHSMPVRDTFMYRSPCCYDVTDVGGRRCYFCSGEFEVKRVGKIRHISDRKPTKKEENPDTPIADAQLLLPYMKLRMLGYRDNITDIPFNLRDVNPDILRWIPDAFEVSYTFNPIISENFNTFLYYFLQGVDGNPAASIVPQLKTGNAKSQSVKYGAEINFLGDKIMKDFSDAVAKEIAATAPKVDPNAK